MRKINSILFICFLFFCTCLIGCDGDVANAGSSTLSDSDEICVKSDTFSVISALDSCAAISLTPDSFLLGECDTHFGTLKADIPKAQFLRELFLTVFLSETNVEERFSL